MYVWNIHSETLHLLHWIPINNSFDSPDSVSLDDLLNIKLGEEGIATVVYFLADQSIVILTLSLSPKGITARLLRSYWSPCSIQATTALHWQLASVQNANPDQNSPIPSELVRKPHISVLESTWKVAKYRLVTPFHMLRIAVSGCLILAYGIDRISGANTPSKVTWGTGIKFIRHLNSCFVVLLRISRIIVYCPCDSFMHLFLPSTMQIQWQTTFRPFSFQLHNWLLEDSSALTCFDLALERRQTILFFMHSRYTTVECIYPSANWAKREKWLLQYM